MRSPPNTPAQFSNLLLPSISTASPSSQPLVAGGIEHLCSHLLNMAHINLITSHLQRFPGNVCSPECTVDGVDSAGLQVASVGQVGSMAQVHHRAASVQGDGCILWQPLDDLHLELVFLKHGQRLVPAHHHSLEGLLLLRDLPQHSIAIGTSDVPNLHIIFSEKFVEFLQAKASLMQIVRNFLISSSHWLNIEILNASCQIHNILEGRAATVPAQSSSLEWASQHPSECVRPCSSHSKSLPQWRVRWSA